MSHPISAPLQRAGRNLRSARTQLDDAMEAARLACLAAVVDGTPETVIAKTLGVDRMTVRKWRGKL